MPLLIDNTTTSLSVLLRNDMLDEIMKLDELLYQVSLNAASLSGTLSPLEKESLRESFLALAVALEKKGINVTAQN